MLRPATLSDLPQLFELVTAMHGASKYVEMEIDVDPAAAKSILLDGVRRSGGQYLGATLLNVVEVNGRLEAFMLGILQRVYSIGNRLEAQDFWLFATKKAPATSIPRLTDAYIKWAENNPKVAEICLSWTDALKGSGESLGRMYKRKGFEKVGEIWKRETE